MTKDPDSVIDEGVIKFQLNWDQTNLRSNPALAELIKYRNILRENNCIGAYAQGIGFGNISVRKDQTSQFYISGSQTGHIEIADESHMSLITQCSVKKNELFCQGAVKASSESLTHSMFYDLDPQIGAVVHIHHEQLWTKYLYQFPTTAENVPYGTTQMAFEIKRLFEQENLKEEKILVMVGDHEGLISFGEDLEQASQLFLRLLN